MKIGYVGLGKMGMAMTQRLLEKGHEVVAYNRSEEPLMEAKKHGAIVCGDLKELVSNLEGPRVIWLMVSWQAVDLVLKDLIPLLSPGDLIIDGGNSPYTETVKRAKILAEKEIGFLDIGVSGGPNGARHGACLMIGGDKELYEKNINLFVDLSLDGQSFDYFGKHGAGHFVKMIHNGIEYGIMQSIGEGFEILKKSDYQFDLEKISNIYNKGSVIESKLIAWLNEAYKKYGQDLGEISNKVGHSGEAEWTIQAAKKLKVKTPAIQTSLKFRKKSGRKYSYTAKVLGALRNMFGGHSIK